MNNAEFLKLEREWSELQETKACLEALIYHLEGEGAKIYDNAPQRGLYIEKSPCPPKYIQDQKKNSADILKDCKMSLGEVEEKLEKIDNKLRKLANEKF